MLNVTVTFQETVVQNTTTIDEDAVNITVVQKNGKDGADGADGSDAEVTSENIATALGYTPADSADVLTPVPTNALFSDTVYDDTALTDRVSTNETDIVNLNKKTIEVNSISDLKTLEEPTDDTTADVLGYYDSGDGGGGVFYWDAESTEADNGGTIIEITGITTGRWKRIFSDAVNIKWFGAKGDGVTDDTIPIEKCFSFASEIVKTIIDSANWNKLSLNHINIPSGEYVYNGSGINDPLNIKITGSGISNTQIILNNNYLFTPTNSIASFHCEGIYFSGGKGVFLDSFSSANVSVGISFTRCSFINFSECAIGFINPTDRPRVEISYCAFTSNLVDNTISIVLPPGGGHIVNHCWFNGGTYDIKLTGDQLGECEISNNRFGSRVQNGNRCNIWIVPTNNIGNSGRGIKIIGNLHGSENMKNGNTFVLVADEGAGEGYHNKMHIETTSSGLLYGFIIKDNVYSGNTDIDQSPLKSFTNNIGEYIWSNYLDGTYPPKIIDIVPGQPVSNPRFFDADISVLSKNSGAVTLPEVGINIPIKNEKGLYQDRSQIEYFGGYQSEFSEVLINRDGFTNLSLGNATKINIPDSLGGTSASEVTFNAVTNVRYTLPDTNIKPNEILWVELDIAKSSINSLDVVQVAIQRNSSDRVIKRQIRLEDEWTRVRFPVILSEAVTHQIAVYPEGFVAGSKEKFRIGVPSAYHSRSPVNYGHLKVQGSWNGSHIISNDYHEWIDSNGKKRIKNGIPNSDIDGEQIIDDTYLKQTIRTFTAKQNFSDISVETGATGSFTSMDGKTITVTDGIITSIV